MRVLLLLLLLVGPALAISDPAEMLPNAGQEARAEAVGRQLRCLVCQNESIEDSNADLAKDLRHLVRVQIGGGATDTEAVAWVVARYGDFVRLRPPVNAVTALLWGSPVIAVGVGLLAVVLAAAACGRGGAVDAGGAGAAGRADGTVEGPMVWIAIGLLAVAALAPLTVALERGAASRGARDLAVSLHRAQLAELDRDLVEGRILPPEHATAVLEVQRRLLSAAGKPEASARVGSRWPVLATAALVPAAALGLYLVGGTPSMPSVRPGGDQAQAQRGMEEAMLIAQLRERLEAMDPATDQARQGWVLLGNVEEARGNNAAAAEAWNTALRSRFDPVLAVRTAQAAERAEGGLSTGSATLLRRALAAAPADAEWRGMVEERLKRAGL